MKKYSAGVKIDFSFEENPLSRLNEIIYTDISMYENAKHTVRKRGDLLLSYLRHKGVNYFCVTAYCKIGSMVLNILNLKDYSLDIFKEIYQYSGSSVPIILIDPVPHSFLKFDRYGSINYSEANYMELLKTKEKFYWIQEYVNTPNSLRFITG